MKLWQARSHSLTTDLLTYMISILMSLIMLAMVFVMITMSVASGRYIEEVLGT